MTPAGASDRVTRLPWDSDVLGRPVARASVAGLDAGATREVLEAVRRDGAAVTYLFGDPGGDDARALLDAAGAAIVDDRTTYVRAVDPTLAGTRPAGVMLHDCSVPDESLCALALASGVHSRFRVDPRMPPQVFDRIYEEWIARSLSGEIAEAVYVARGADAPALPQVAGMVTLGAKLGRANIGLLAVAPSARGRGVGRALVRAADVWAADRGYAVAQVVTQGANAPARRLYEACGYAVESVTPVRHLWRDV